MDLHTVELRVMHFRDCALGIVDFFVKDVCNAAIYVDYVVD